MSNIKVTTWNIKHLARLLPSPNSDYERERLRGIIETIDEIDPDVLCVIEAPDEQSDMQAFVDALSGNYRLMTLRNNDYDIRGTQFIWFLVKEPLADNAKLQSPKVWQEFAGKNWEVNYWGDMTVSRHFHWRHPQVLAVDIAGTRVEFVGLHLKSKINRERPFDADGNLTRAYVDTAMKARVKLATEAANVRAYIDARFNQSPNPAIFLMGDLNDGPGKELFETRYLFFDLLSNLQGDVFFARKFFNHALFDFPDHLRWTCTFRDRVDPSRDPKILLDHILFSQALVDGSLPFSVNSGAGSVEHEIHDRINAELNLGAETSDHKPVSCIIST